MEIFNYQKFLGVIVFGYFAVKIVRISEYNPYCCARVVCIEDVARVATHGPPGTCRNVHRCLDRGWVVVCSGGLGMMNGL